MVSHGVPAVLNGELGFGGWSAAIYGCPDWGWGGRLLSRWVEWAVLSLRWVPSADWFYRESAVIVHELHELQEKHGWLTSKGLHELAEKLNVPVHHLHGVASFYPHFRLKPPPKATLHVCTDISCHMRGAPALLQQMRDMAVAAGGGSGGEEIEVKNCSCLGQCDGAPAMLINDEVYARQSLEQLAYWAGQAIGGREVPALSLAPGAKGPYRTNPYATELEHYGALKAILAGGNGGGDDVLKKMAAANLKGMGGAGFPTNRKWEAVKAQPVPAGGKKYVICNADESEVGTFKDRELMKQLPWLLVEAMIICAVVTGAEVGYIYIRHEYHEQIHVLEREIEKAKLMGLVGENILGSGKKFDLSVFVSPGGYVQGEETALMEAIEGNRGQPRNKISDVGLMRAAPVFQGLHASPTVINNVETFCYVPAILVKGPEWFKAQGVNGCEGLKWIGVSGDVNRPGVFEVPMGITYREVIENLAGGIIGGKKMIAFAPSGPSFGLLPAEKADLKLDWNTSVDPVGRILGSGAVVAVAEGRDIVDLALNFTRFYRNESCGKCVPCRVGSQKMVDLIFGILQGTATQEDLAMVPQLAETMSMTSICGLGQVVASPIKSVLAFFKAEVDAHIAAGRAKTTADASFRSSATGNNGHTPVMITAGGKVLR